MHDKKDEKMQYAMKVEHKKPGRKDAKLKMEVIRIILLAFSENI